MAVQNEFGTTLLHDFTERFCVGQSLSPAYDAGYRWMMDEHDPKQTLSGGLDQKFAKPVQLVSADAADG